MSGPQHRASRCVFVGNIPYDATEEQLVQICEEVGPVVSFRLVVDRETGKPKGYGFCEFRDEETALSARRNLQGYEINGRQLRVDFAENEKGGGGVDRSREQGRGGPGLPPSGSNPDTQKQTGGLGGSQLGLSSGGSVLEQPIGRAAASAAALVMAGALGTPQVLPSMMGGSGQAMNAPAPVNGNGGGAASTDSLTNHLAGMSKQQLYEIMSQMKVMIQQNQQQARQILIANPQLTKALFQAQIMLGMVRPPQMPSQQAQQPQQTSNLMQQQATRPVHSQQPSQLQPQSTSKVNFQPLPPTQQQHQQSQSQQTPLQQQLPQTQPSYQTSMGMALPHGQPPPPNQPPPQQLYQINPSTANARMSGDTGISSGMGQGNNGIMSNSQTGRGPGMSGGLGSNRAQLNQGPSSGSVGNTHSQGVALPMGGASHSLSGNAGMGASGLQGLQMMGDTSARGYGSINTGLNSGMNTTLNSGINPTGNANINSSMNTAISTGINSGMNAGLNTGMNQGLNTGMNPGISGLNSGINQGMNAGMNPGMTNMNVQQGGGNMNAGQMSSVNAGISSGMSMQQGGGFTGSMDGTGGSNVGMQSQAYNQVHLQTPQAPQQLQVPLELEQQKALLQQVMNLTTEQIMSLPAEQRQQVFQLQQALR